MNIIGEVAQQVEGYFEEKITCFKVLLDLTREQKKMTKEEDIDLKKLDLILQRKEDQRNKIERINHFLRGLDGSQIMEEKTTGLAQIIKDLVSLEEISHQNLLTSQLALKEELLDHHRKRGLKQLYINQPGRINHPKFMEKKI